MIIFYVGIIFETVTSLKQNENVKILSSQFVLQKYYFHFFQRTNSCMSIHITVFVVYNKTQRDISFVQNVTLQMRERICWLV